MAKRESRQKSRQSDAVRGEKKRVRGDRDTVVYEFGIGPFYTTEAINRDAETLRRVREWAMSARSWPTPHDDFDTGYTSAAHQVLSILNGTERKEKTNGKA